MILTLINSVGSNPLDWSLGRHTAAWGRVWGGSRSVPQWCKGEGSPLSSVFPFLKGVVYNYTVSMLLQSRRIYMCTQSDIKSCFKQNSHNEIYIYRSNWKKVGVIFLRKGYCLLSLNKLYRSYFLIGAAFFFDVY